MFSPPFPRVVVWLGMHTRKRYDRKDGMEDLPDAQRREVSASLENGRSAVGKNNMR